MPSRTRHAASVRRSAWIPWLFVGAFGVILAANGALVHYALSTRIGLVGDDPYARGLATERLIEEADREAALGWTLRLRPGVLEAGRATIVLDVADAAGPLAEAQAVVRMTRPIEGDAADPADVRIVAGHGEATVAGLRPGQWEAAVTVSREGRTVRFFRRLVLR
jgi:nitrogen fixation protein FixH